MAEAKAQTTDTGTGDAAPETMGAGDAARYLGRSPGYLSSLRSWGTGPRYAKDDRGHVSYRRADLDAWRAEKPARHAAGHGA